MDILRYEEAKRLYLSYFPHPQRSGAANHLLEAVRAGCDEPNQVVGFALERARYKSQWSDYARLFLVMAELDTDAIFAGARWALWWETLSPTEKAAYRRPQQERAIQAWMETQAPTEKQVAYLRALGYTGPEPSSRAEASRLIESHKRVGVRNG